MNIEDEFEQLLRETAIEDDEDDDEENDDDADDDADGGAGDCSGVQTGGGGFRRWRGVVADNGRGGGWEWAEVGSVDGLGIISRHVCLVVLVYVSCK